MDPHATPIRYRVSSIPDECIEGTCSARHWTDIYSFCFYVLRSHAGWVVTDGSDITVYRKDGHAEYSRCPASQPGRQEWIDACAYPDLNGALSKAMKWSAEMTVGRHMVTQAWALHEAEHDGEEAVVPSLSESA